MEIDRGIVYDKRFIKWIIIYICFLIYFQLKKFAESVSDCDEALKLDKDYLKAFLRRGRSYMEMEKYDEAIRDFEQINKMERGKIKVQIF